MWFTVVLLLFIGLREASTAQCYIKIFQDQPKLIEVCTYTTNPFVLDCYAGSQPDSGLATCESILTDSSLCSGKINLAVFGDHELPVSKNVLENCPSKSFSVHLKVSRNADHYSALFEKSMQVSNLKIENAKIGQGYDAERGSLNNWYKYLKVKTLELVSLDASEVVLGGNQMSFKDMDSVTLRDIDFKGLSATAVSFQDVAAIRLDDLTFEAQPEAAAFQIQYGNGYRCPQKQQTLIIDNIRIRLGFGKNPFYLNIYCSGELDLKITLSNSAYYEVPEEVFRQLFQPRADKSRYRLTFESDKIECCSEANTWLFADPAARNATSQVECYDIEGRVGQLSKDLRQTACLNRNVLPIYLIILIAVVSILLLAVGGAIIFYFRSKRANADGQAIASDPNSGSGVRVSEIDSGGKPPPKGLGGAKAVSDTGTMRSAHYASQLPTEARAPAKVAPPKRHSRSTSRRRHSKRKQANPANAKNGPTSKATVIKVNSLTPEGSTASPPVIALSSLNQSPITATTKLPTPPHGHRPHGSPTPGTQEESALMPAGIVYEPPTLPTLLNQLNKFTAERSQKTKTKTTKKLV